MDSRNFASGHFCVSTPLTATFPDIKEGSTALKSAIIRLLFPDLSNTLVVETRRRIKAYPDRPQTPIF
jgi:hypothetical protein